MKKTHVARIVAIGGMGILDSVEEEGKLIMEQEGFPPEYLAVSTEHMKAFKILDESGLDWTMVCPPDIKDEEPSGIFTTNADHLPVINNYKIKAGDIALFMLNELVKKEYIHHRVGISN